MSSQHGKRTKKAEETKPKISECFSEPSFVHKLSEAFTKKEYFKDDATSSVLLANPFQCGQMTNFVSGDTFLEDLVVELNSQEFCPKSNDLYKFEQSDDLKRLSAPHIKGIREFFQDVKQWMISVTGIPLNDTIDLTCSRYAYTDILLCHDDELDSRRVAFILYLVPPWNPEDGGQLALFDMDEYKQPNKIVKTLTPAWNNFTWFEVSEASHHQVTEVLSKEKTRLSINGWFHGPLEARPERHQEKSPVLQIARPLQAETALSWINPIYWDEVTQLEIQQRFEEDSEIELTDFLSEEKYNTLMAALQSPDVKWEKTTPPNKRNFFQLSAEDSPAIVRDCVELLTSEPVFLLLSQLTGLSLHSLAEEAQRRVKEVSDKEKEWSEEGDIGNNSVENQASSSNDELVIKKAKLSNDTDVSSDVSQIASAANSSQSQEQARCQSCVRKWRNGCYTLAHDKNAELGNFSLDAVLYINCGDWETEYGGYTSYIADGEDEELLSICPRENSFTLVYRDEDTLKFVKHVNHQATEANKSEFYDIAVSYYEKNEK